MPSPLPLPSPGYTATPSTHEYRVELGPRLRPNRPPRLFVKQTKNGNVSLKLVDQDDQVAVPVYGIGASIKGTVEIRQTKGVTSVEVQAEGILELEEIGEGGKSTHRLFLNRNMLWIKDRIREAPCPNSLRFHFVLPTAYSNKDESFLLPPSFDAHLAGIPGFRANVRYSVTAVVVKPNDVSNTMVRLFRKDKDDGTLSTAFLYLPRARPSTPIPAPLVATPSSCGFAETPHWKLFSSVIEANQQETQNVVAKFYVPTTQILCVRQPNPFYLSFHSDPKSLHIFSPLAPTAGLISPKSQTTRIQLMRQISVDVRLRNVIMLGTKADIWRVDCIGEGAFRNAGKGTDWVAFSGDIFISNEVTVGGFRASGITVRDYLVLAMIPPDFIKSPFKELRMVIPVRLVTDRWNNDNAGPEPHSLSSISSSASYEEIVAMSKLSYASHNMPTLASNCFPE